MSGFPAETVDSILDLRKTMEIMKRQIEVLDRGQVRLEGQVNAAVQQIGEAAYGPFSYSPPPFLVRLESYLELGIWSARRLVPDSAGFLLDDEDERLYHVRETPWTAGTFVGARGWVQHTHKHTNLIAEQSPTVEAAVYSTLGGEWSGFMATVRDDPIVDSGKTLYPWAQYGLVAGDCYTDATEFNSTPLGEAWLMTEAGQEDFDPAIDRVTLPIGSPCWVFYCRTEGQFVMMQITEPQNVECPT